MSEKLTERLQVRVTPAMLRGLQQAAGALRLTLPGVTRAALSTFVREHVDGVGKPSDKAPPDAQRR